MNNREILKIKRFFKYLNGYRKEELNRGVEIEAGS